MLNLEYYVEALQFAYQIRKGEVSLEECKRLYIDYNFEHSKPVDMAEDIICKCLKERIKRGE